MKSPNISILNNCRNNSKKAGFTMIELLIAIGLLVVIAGLGLLISFDFYRHYSLRSEGSTIVSVLQKARSLSMNNVDENRHGVHFQSSSSTLQYIIFECSACTSYPGASSSDNILNASYNFSLTQPSLPFDVVFEQLSGNCISSNCTSSSTLAISADDGTKSYSVNVNSEGQIDY